MAEPTKQVESTTAARAVRRNTQSVESPIEHEGLAGNVSYCHTDGRSDSTLVDLDTHDVFSGERTIVYPTMPVSVHIQYGLCESPRRIRKAGEERVMVGRRRGVSKYHSTVHGAYRSP